MFQQTDHNSPPQSDKAFPYIERSVYQNEAFNKHLNTKIQSSLLAHIQGNLGFFNVDSVPDFVRKLLSDFFAGRLSYHTIKIEETAGNLRFPQVSDRIPQAETSGFLEPVSAGNLDDVSFLENRLLQLYAINGIERRFVDVEEHSTLQVAYAALRNEYDAILGEVMTDGSEMIIMSLEELQALCLTDEKIEDIISMVDDFENAFDLIKQKYGTREPE